MKIGWMRVCSACLRVYLITNLNCAKPKWWNYENRCVQQFPDFHVFHSSNLRPSVTCVWVCTVREQSTVTTLHVRIFSSLFVYYLHERMLVIEHTHSLTLSFSAMNFCHWTHFMNVAFRPKIFQNLRHSKMNILILSHKLKSGKFKRARFSLYVSK